MKIIQVIDLDGTTVKVDETNPSEPKIVSALQFDLGVCKNVAIGDIAELVFAKPTNANVEAVCVGYKGKDGKLYGVGESMFTPEPEPEPKPQPPVTETRRGFIELTIPSDYAGPPELRIRPQNGDGNNYRVNELYTGADLNNGIYATLGDNKVYHFSHVSFDGEGVHTLRADEVYRTNLGSTMYVMFGTTAGAPEYAATLTEANDAFDGLSYSGGKFRLDAHGTSHIQSSLEQLDHL